MGGSIGIDEAGTRTLQRVRVAHQLRSASSEHIAGLQNCLTELRREAPDSLKASLSECDEAVADMIRCIDELAVENDR